MKKLIYAIAFCLCIFKANAQQDTLNKTTLTLAALYNSNVSYYGQATTEKLPYVLVNTTLRLPLGIYFSAGSYKLLNYGPIVSETDLGIGYDYDFSTKLTAGIGYTHSFFPTNSQLLRASNENNLNLSVNYEWPWFKSSLSTDYAFGKEQDVFVSLTNSKEISLWSLFKDKGQISIEPAFELSTGTRHFIETYLVQKEKHANNGKAPNSPGNSGQNTSTTVTIANTDFQVLSYNFKLPLTFSRANYMAEASAQFSILGKHNEAELKSQQAFFGLAFYYQF
ncbi:hypothetical protein [Pedobacter boryungensis]|uniref:MipA/OmpV family protein n=1 Tax=Pedobacter boryungensis TaxID=869962 RepID=A0ABX2D9P0_9SPHI|nr:hypothetical protein [Pedobacter boryungensis]NQX30783.1 hypothetical protein [Pedobacter boryungensis]